jgi:hypothetical protein
VRLRPGQGKGRLGKLLQMRRKVEDGSVGLAAGRNPELAAAASNGAAAAQAVDGGHMRSSPCGASFVVARWPLLRGVEKGGLGTGSAWGGARAARTGRPTGRDQRSVQCLSGRAA